MDNRLSFRPEPQAEWRNLELLAPARTADIGIAAIDCGADAVYIAGPAFGARQAAGNPVEDIRRLCDYAHRFGARIYVTFNTLIYEEEIPQARRLLQELQEAGVDALIVQDAAVTRLAPEGMILHASTQCAIRTPEKARFTESLGYGRLVLERELSLEQIRAIRDAVDAELEVFVHGALCVCYSGQCYLSEHLAGRSANRGACVQACRSLYDLEDGEGKVLARNKALLSLKDFNLIHRLEDLAEAGADSFKIEGRLKSISYVRNVVRAYSEALDALVRRYPDRYRRASFGTPRGGFTPDLKKTFNRDYTELFLDGVRGSWSSMDAPKSMGEAVGTVQRIRRQAGRTMTFEVRPLRRDLALHNGDGFAIATADGVTGFRGDVCEGLQVSCKDVPDLREGMTLYRNINTAFEKMLETQTCHREVPVHLSLRLHGKYVLEVRAVTADGREVLSPFHMDVETAENRERAEAMLREQLSKRSGVYHFSLDELLVETAGGNLPLLSASTINGIRRLVAEDLDGVPAPGRSAAPRRPRPDREALTLISRPAMEPLMRSKYCVRYELGLCPKYQGAKPPQELFLLNNGRRLALRFDCAACEMTVISDQK